MTSAMARLGTGRIEVLTTVGSRSGKPQTVPVSPIEVGGTEYLVAPYGRASGWVKNVRAHPSAHLAKGSRTRKVRLQEVRGEEAATVVSLYYQREPFARPFMEVPNSPSVSDFAAAGDRFPVFRVQDAE
ncbi:MAG TPA: nitroreductase family deazaflavin-dependent oxidoreductase [Acidimicrobiia bacterium]|nr:nitroreductase family deazaflavin-dependent oxidoreductase [Acidimicrobiia bacterium]